MPITILRNRLVETVRDEYMEIAAELNDMAPKMQGYVSHKRFVADDGERVTIVEFEDDETQKAWANVPQHRRAMAMGKSRFFAEYDIAVCTVTRRYSTKTDAED